MSALIALATSVGAPLVEKILSRKIGSDNARLATEVVGAIAKRAGVAPEALEEEAARDPDKVGIAIQDVNADVAPELLELLDAELQSKTALLTAETGEAAWISAWRPIGMYFTMFLWLWNAMLLHVANAIWKIALPPMEWPVLMSWSALYLSLYMGGHTVKSVVGDWLKR
jgi:hypothetical protein